MLRYWRKNEMRLVYGKESRFINFIGNLDDKDRIGLITHNDPDGVVSALVAKKIVGKAEYIAFVNYKKNFALELVDYLKKKKINKIIFTDLCLEEEKDNIKKLEKFAEILILDHHQNNFDLNSSKTFFLVSEKKIPASLLSYNLFKKFQDISDLDILVGLAVVSDYALDENPDFFNSIKKKYNLSEDQLKKLAMIFGSASVYFKRNLIKFMSIAEKIKKIDDLSIFEKYFQLVDKEVTRLVKEFDEKKEAYPWGYIYKTHTRYGIHSVVSTLLSEKEREKLFIIYHETDDGLISISTRRQGERINCADLLKKTVFGLKGASAGGHIPAAGAQINKSEFPKFKKRLLEELKNKK